MSSFSINTAIMATVALPSLNLLSIIFRSYRMENSLSKKFGTNIFCRKLWLNVFVTDGLPYRTAYCEQVISSFVPCTITLYTYKEGDCSAGGSFYNQVFNHCKHYNTEHFQERRRKWFGKTFARTFLSKTSFHMVRIIIFSLFKVRFGKYLHIYFDNVRIMLVFFL